jgi:hypothetical protein
MNRYEYKARLSEPSTWAAFSVISSLFGADVMPDTWASIATTVAAAMAVFIPEKGATK